MAVDRSRLEQLIARQIEAVEEDYGDDWEIGNICCIFEAVRPEGVDVRVRNTGGPVSAYGLLSLALQGYSPETSREEATGEEPLDEPSPEG